MPVEELAAFGLYADGPVRVDDDEPFYLWPANVRAWGFWLSLQSQWAWCGAGMGDMVRTGIPAERIEAEMRLQRVRKRERADLHAMARAMEVAALAGYREQHERKR
ncbi:MAG: hypothetical protein ABS84_14915 [Rubrivivax sp. SCN 71-131]|nr:MAG: hypothetical protein ABS84_14915 [Rubrivivax sp. SCN 71-131]